MLIPGPQLIKVHSHAVGANLQFKNVYNNHRRAVDVIIEKQKTRPGCGPQDTSGPQFKIEWAAMCKVALIYNIKVVYKLLFGKGDYCSIDYLAVVNNKLVGFCVTSSKDTAQECIDHTYKGFLVTDGAVNGINNGYDAEIEVIMVYAFSDGEIKCAPGRAIAECQIGNNNIHYFDGGKIARGYGSWIFDPCNMVQDNFSFRLQSPIVLQDVVDIWNRYNEKSRPFIMKLLAAAR